MKQRERPASEPTFDADEHLRRYVSLLLWIAEEVENNQEMRQRFEDLTKKKPANTFKHNMGEVPPTTLV